MSDLPSVTDDDVVGLVELVQDVFNTDDWQVAITAEHDQASRTITLTVHYAPMVEPA